ncbi:MAG: hypothetical protein IIW48_00260 [Clostridia bacterium]|nr:hypothetical protein [Clostridia bacterium]
MKSLKKIFAVLLSLLMVFSAVAVATSAGAATAEEETDNTYIESTITCNRKYGDPVYVRIDGKAYNLINPVEAVIAMINADTEQEKKTIGFTYLELVFMDILNLLAVPAPVANTTFVDANEYDSANFMAGHEEFITSNPNGQWSLGYDQTSLVPDDILDRPYYLGGYLLQNFPSNTVEEVLDDMNVYTVVMDDGSGRGKVAFCTIECIGISNKDIRDVRAMLADFAKENNIVSINVTATHCHSEIDTMGLWNPFFLKMANNTLAALTGQFIFKTMPGPDEQFMNLLKERTAQSIKNAVADMEEGDLYFSQKDCAEYFSDDRDPTGYDGNLYVFRFDPYAEGVEETLIINEPAHPYITGLKTDDSSGKQLSGDYTAAMNQVLTENGYNFMPIIGATLGIYSDRGPTNDGVDMSARWMQADRYGKELAYIAMSMTKTLDEILVSDYVDVAAIEAEKAAAAEGQYTVWYEDWEPVEETKVDPVLNVAHQEVIITVENPVLLLVGKLGLVNHRILDNGDGTYSTPTEVGYAEFGTKIKVAMMPGEISPELIYGGVTLDAENAFSGTDFNGKSCAESLELADDEVLLCFGLCNDEIGYILNDNDYCMIFFDDMEPFGDHYQETIAFSRNSGSLLMKGFEELVG